MSFVSSPNALDVISPISIVGFVVGDVELAREGDSERVRCVVYLSFRPDSHLESSDHQFQSKVRMVLTNVSEIKQLCI